MEPARAEHFVVYRDDEYFSAWPFNGGFWQFKDGEMAVGFIRGKVDYENPDTVSHHYVDVEHGEHVVLRSTDGGRTWPVENMVSVYQRPEFDQEVARNLRITAINEPGADPRDDDFCLICVYGIPPEGMKDVAVVMISTDRGRTWKNPVRLHPCSFVTLGGRPSYIVRPDGMLLLFVHASRHREEPGPGLRSEDRAVPLVYGSWDGGGNWGLITEVELTPEKPMGIMPCPLQLADGRILIAVRRQYNMWNAYTQIYVSDDGAHSWRYLSRPNDWGAPANLVQLPDGRVVCVYGYRQHPWGVRARVSEDLGETWGEEIIVRDDGGSRDLGYPRTVVRPDGSLFTVYYFNDRNDTVDAQGGVRYIAGTEWEV